MVEIEEYDVRQMKWRLAICRRMWRSHHVRQTYSLFVSNGDIKRLKKVLLSLYEWFIV